MTKVMKMYSIYEVLLKASNRFQGVVTSKMLHSTPSKKRQNITQTLNGNLWLDCFDNPFPLDTYYGYRGTDGESIATFQTDGAVNLMTVEGSDDVFRTRVLCSPYWVYSIYHDGLSWELRGFYSKQAALRYLRQMRQAVESIFDAVFFKMGTSKYSTLRPIYEYEYPVVKYLDAEYDKYSSHSKNPKKFDAWVFEYIGMWISSNIRVFGEEADAWLTLQHDLKEIQAEIAKGSTIHYGRLFEIFDKALGYQFEGADIDELFI